MKPHGAIYARVSGTDDKRMASIDTQIEKTKEKLADCVITDADIFIERYTGKLLRERPELNRLRDLIRSGRYQKLGIYCLDRLARRATYLSVIFEEAEYYGCEIISATEEIECTPEGELMRSVRGFTAEVERIKTAERTARGVRKLLDNDKLICAGTARYGYRYVKQTRERIVVPEHAAQVLRIYKMAAVGSSIRSIALALTADSIPSPRGKRVWSEDTVRNILRDPSYRGERMTWQKTKHTGRRANGHAQVEYTPPEQQRLIGPPTPVIVDQVTWHKAQRALDRAQTVANRVTAHKKFRLLSGMIPCRCGCSVTTQQCHRWKGGAPYEYYICSSKRAKPGSCDQPRRQISQVELEVWQRVSQTLTDRATLQRALDRARGDTTDLEGELRAHRQLIADAEATASRLIRTLVGLTDEIVTKPLREQLAKLSASVVGYREQVRELEGRLAQRDQVTWNLEEVLKVFHSACPLAWLESGPVERLVFEANPCPERKRQVLRDFGVTVTLDYREVRVELIPPVRANGSPGRMSEARRLSTRE